MLQQQATQPLALPPMNFLTWHCHGCCRWYRHYCTLHLARACARITHQGSCLLMRSLRQGFDEERARPALEEALKPRTRKGKTLPNKMDLEQLVGR